MLFYPLWMLVHIGYGAVKLRLPGNMQASGQKMNSRI